MEGNKSKPQSTFKKKPIVVCALSISILCVSLLIGSTMLLQTNPQSTDTSDSRGSTSVDANENATSNPEIDQNVKTLEAVTTFLEWYAHSTKDGLYRTFAAMLSDVNLNGSTPIDITMSTGNIALHITNGSTNTEYDFKWYYTGENGNTEKTFVLTCDNDTIKHYQDNWDRTTSGSVELSKEEALVIVKAALKNYHSPVEDPAVSDALSGFVVGTVKNATLQYHTEKQMGVGERIENRSDSEGVYPVWYFLVWFDRDYVINETDGAVGATVWVWADTGQVCSIGLLYSYIG